MRLLYLFCLTTLMLTLFGCKNKIEQEEKPEPPKTYANSTFAERIWTNWEVSQAEAKETNPNTPNVVAEDKKQLKSVREYILKVNNEQPVAKENNE